MVAHRFFFHEKAMQKSLDEVARSPKMLINSILFLKRSLWYYILMEVIPIICEDQKRAAQCHGPALVLSSAGSGKTRALAYRVSYLLAEGAFLSEILILSFNNKAANEIQSREEKPCLGWGLSTRALFAF